MFTYHIKSESNQANVEIPFSSNIPLSEFCTFKNIDELVNNAIITFKNFVAIENYLEGKDILICSENMQPILKVQISDRNDFELSHYHWELILEDYWFKTSFGAFGKFQSYVTIESILNYGCLLNDKTKISQFDSIYNLKHSLREQLLIDVKNSLSFQDSNSSSGDLSIFLNYFEEDDELSDEIVEAKFSVVDGTLEIIAKNA